VTGETKNNFRVKFLPFDTGVDVPAGTSILDAARKAGLPLRASCGGKGTCGECVVRIGSGSFQSKSSAALPEKLIGQGYALACITEVQGDLTVTLPKFQQLSIKNVSDSDFFEKHRDEISGIHEIDPPASRAGLARNYGLACDIGTTSVALYLVDLENGKILDTASGYNQQIICGEDVISRIVYSQKVGRLEELRDLILSTINQLIRRVSEDLGISQDEIGFAAVSGNTTMMHLFLGVDPGPIRRAAYVPANKQFAHFYVRDTGLEINSEGEVLCAPAVGSYVGGDITYGLLCTPMLRDPEKISIFIDIGTNGELVAGNSEWLATCACSAGPAFEGSGIKCGMQATEGAIESVKAGVDGKFNYHVIGQGKPKGLCGSGLIDLLAELFGNGYIDRAGKYNVDKENSRIVETESGRGFIVERGESSFWGSDLLITENDIANLIRTKGAIFSACSLLMKNLGLDFDMIESFYIAGGFGLNLNIENAVRIGLFPDLNRSRFHYLGNSSLLGAYLVLICEKNRKMVDRIAGKMTYIDLITEPGYMNEYTGALFLPHTDMDLFPSVRKLFELKP